MIEMIDLVWFMRSGGNDIKKNKAGCVNVIEETVIDQKISMDK